MDARGNGQSIAEAMRDEFGAEVCESVMLSENWYRTHTAPFKAALEDGTLDAIPKDEDILTDLRAFELVRGVPRIPDVRTKGQDGKKRHGDAAIAFVLLARLAQEYGHSFKIVGNKLVFADNAELKQRPAVAVLLPEDIIRKRTRHRRAQLSRAKSRQPVEFAVSL